MALHGENGENGKIQAAFDLFGIKYTGTGYLSSALAMDKGMAKQLFIAGGIPTPQGISMKKENRKDSAKELGLKLPCVVKPCCGGSSIGVTIVRTEDEFKSALDEAFKWEDNLIIEEYVEGREFSIGVIDYKALPVIEIAPIRDSMITRISTKQAVQLKPVRQNYRKRSQSGCSITQSAWQRC